MFRTLGPLALGGLLFAGCAGGGDLDKVNDKGPEETDSRTVDDTDTYSGDTYEPPTSNNGGQNGGNNRGGGNGGGNGGNNRPSFPDTGLIPPGGSGFVPPGGSGFVPPGGSGFVPPGGSGFGGGGTGFPAIPFAPNEGAMPQPLPPLGSQPEALFAFP